MPVLSRDHYPVADGLAGFALGLVAAAIWLHILTVGPERAELGRRAP